MQSTKPKGKMVQVSTTRGWYCRCCAPPLDDALRRKTKRRERQQWKEEVNKYLGS